MDEKLYTLNWICSFVVTRSTLLSFFMLCVFDFYRNICAEMLQCSTYKQQRRLCLLLCDSKFEKRTVGANRRAWKAKLLCSKLLHYVACNSHIPQTLNFHTKVFWIQEAWMMARTPSTITFACGNLTDMGKINSWGFNLKWNCRL